MAKTILVTGASRGLGLLSAVELARRGHRVFAGARTPEASPALDAAIATAGVSVEKISLDVSESTSISRAVAEVLEKAGHIDVLINNAGITRIGFFEALTLREIDDVMRVNFTGTMLMMHAVLPSMRERGRGNIVNISSVYGFAGCPVNSAYSASKWALEGLSESLRYELAPLGLYVSLVEAGAFKTELLDSGSERLQDPTSPYYAAALNLTQFFKKEFFSRAADPKLVANLVADVSEAEKPQLRYMVGMDTHLISFLRWSLPASVFEVMFTRPVRKAMQAGK